jgi:hypothetical protein
MARSISAQPSTSSSERFNFTLGMIGLVTNVITLVGFVVGFVKVPEGAAFWSRPAFVSFYSLFFLVFCMILFGLGVINKIRSRSRSVRQRGFNTEDTRFGAFMLLMTLVWVPLYFLWIFAVVEINNLFATKEPDGGVGIVILSFFVIPGGGPLLTGICWTLDHLFKED